MLWVKKTTQDALVKSYANVVGQLREALLACVWHGRWQVSSNILWSGKNMSGANALLPTLVLLLQSSLIRPKMLARNVRAKVLKELHMEVVSHVSSNLFGALM